MILVDSSVWIDVLRKRTTRQTDLLHRLAADETIAVADLCLFEVLQGANPPPALIKARELLGEFAVIAVGGESVAVAAAQNAQVLRSRGIQATTVDCLLATYCIMKGLRFLTAEKDFEPFALHLGLDLMK